MSAHDEAYPTPKLEEIEATAARVAPHLIKTPTVPWPGTEGLASWGEETPVLAKLELFQRTGTFKPRGALNVMMHLSEAERACGVTAVSAGNHAIAVAFAARTLGIAAKVVMHKAANPYRVAQCRHFGAEVVQADDIMAAFDEVRRIQKEEGRVFVHPFEGPHTVAGTATVGLELVRQAGPLEAVIVPVGGGGLIAGVASAVKQLLPGCAVFGVEPVGAQGMTQSLARGAPLEKVAVDTIADSLGAPLHMPQTFALVRRHVDEIVLVDDDALRAAMALMFRDVKLAVEPAGAAAAAALAGPLRERLKGKRTGLVVCGSNIDPETHHRLLGALAHS